MASVPLALPSVDCVPSLEPDEVLDCSCVSQACSSAARVWNGSLEPDVVFEVPELLDVLDDAELVLMGVRSDVGVVRAVVANDQIFEATLLIDTCALL